MTTRERVDRTIFEHLRKAVVVAGYLPDALLVADTAEWKAARTALLTSLGAGKQLIDIFGYGQPDMRLEKSMSRITVDRCEQRKGDLGSYGVEKYEQYEESPGVIKYNRLRYPSGTYDIEYEIRVISDLVAFERIMEDIVTSVYGNMNYVKLLDDNGVANGEPLLVECLGEVNLSHGKTCEKMFKYLAKDVWLEGFTVSETGIVPLSTLEISYYLKPDTTGTENHKQTTIFTP